MIKHIIGQAIYQTTVIMILVFAGILNYTHLYNLKLGDLFIPEFLQVSKNDPNFTTVYSR